MNPLVNFLKKLFSGGGGNSNALYLYVRPYRCGEVVQVRVNLFNDLSLTNDNQGYYCRKLVHGKRCPFPAELHLHFDKSRRLQHTDIEKGDIVSEADYLAYTGDVEGGE